MREGRNTKAREVLATLSQLRDPRNVLLASGVFQLLEHYVEASVQGQHSYRFPTQAWSVMLAEKEKVGALGKKWLWGEDKLKFTGLEAPAKVKEKLVEEGKFVPVVPKGSAQASRHQRVGERVNLQEAGLLEEGGCISDLYNEEGESVKPLAGEAILEVPQDWRRTRRGLFSASDGRGGDTRQLTDKDVEMVEETLEGLAKNIEEKWEQRMQQTELEKASFAAFSKVFDWEEDHGKVTQEGVEAQVSMQSALKMRNLLTNLLDALPANYVEKFTVIEVLDGYASYLKYCTKELDTMHQGEHELYKSWFKVRIGMGLGFEPF